MCMESALTMLQEIRETQLFAPVQKTTVSLVPASPSTDKIPEMISAWQGEQADHVLIKPSIQINSGNDSSNMKDDEQTKPIKENENNNQTKDVPKNQPTTKSVADVKFKSKAPPTLLLPPTKAFTKPEVTSPLLTAAESKQLPRKSRSPCQSPRSPRSPGLMRQFQAVRTGMQFVSNMKPG